jgi:hypothetical protein
VGAGVVLQAVKLSAKALETIKLIKRVQFMGFSLRSLI